MGSLETKVAVLESEIGQMGVLFQKLDYTIERMTDISNSINQMLAVHEQKIESNAEDTEDLYQLVETRRIENEENMKTLHKRITESNKEMTQEMNANVIKIMRALEEVKDFISSQEKQMRKDQDELEERINVLEKKQWFFMGAAAVVGFLAGSFDWIAEIFK